MFGRIKKLWKKEKKVMAILNIEGPIRATGEGRFRKEGGTQEILDFLYTLLDKGYWKSVPGNDRRRKRIPQRVCQRNTRHFQKSRTFPPPGH